MIFLPILNCQVFQDLSLKKAEDDLGGNLSWNPPEVEDSLEGYVVYLANSATGNARVWLLGVIHDVFPEKGGTVSPNHPF